MIFREFPVVEICQLGGVLTSKYLSTDVAWRDLLIGVLLKDVLTHLVEALESGADFLHSLLGSQFRVDLCQSF